MSAKHRARRPEPPASWCRSRYRCSIASRQLAIGTCGGPIINLPNGGWTHEDNIVVVAVPKLTPEKPAEAAQQ